MTENSNVQLSDLFELPRSPHPGALFYVAARQRGGRWRISVPPLQLDDPISCGGWWAIPTAACGDSPRQYNPKYVMAVLSSRASDMINKVDSTSPKALPQWLLPRIKFQTEEYTRRSMTLNGMRMSTEYFESGSLRVLQLVEQRLIVQQRDVVHDILVYLMQQVLDIRLREQEVRLLRAESVAAYLGLDQKRVNMLFSTPHLVPARIAGEIQAEFAGPVRRPLDVLALIEAQVCHLQPVLRLCGRDEKNVLWMIDEISRRLYHGLS